MTRLFVSCACAYVCLCVHTCLCACVCVDYDTKEQVCVLSVLLHGWAPLCGKLSKLNSFHHWCVKTMLGIMQWKQRILSAAVSGMWGHLETISTKLRKTCLECLDHLTWMNHCISMICCFLDSYFKLIHSMDQGRD